MNVQFPFSNYYTSKFVDPLYVPYKESTRAFQSADPLRHPSVKNCIGQRREVDTCFSTRFQKLHSHFPCPPGYVSDGLDFCKQSATTSMFYESDVHFKDPPRWSL